MDILNKSYHIDKITNIKNHVIQETCRLSFIWFEVNKEKFSNDQLSEKKRLYLWNPHINLKSTNLTLYDTMDSSFQYQFILKSYQERFFVCFLLHFTEKRYRRKSPSIHKGGTQGSENNLPQIIHLVQEEGRMISTRFQHDQNRGKGKGHGQSTTSPNRDL